jgi:hypothetical protein
MGWGAGMGWLVWTGAAVTVAGIALLLWCILAVAGARRAGLDEAALKARLQRAVVLNLGALALSGIGLMMVVVGVILA